MRLYCCNCKTDVEPRLTNGAEVYSHRPDLKSLPFWKCDDCKSFVGCHHKSDDRTKPLGCIPSDEVKELRKRIHAVLDPIWKNQQHSRNYLYNKLSNAIGRDYHTADIRNANEANIVLDKLAELKNKQRPKN